MAPKSDGPHSVCVRVLRVAGAEDLALPSYATAGSSGLDLYAAVTEPVALAPGQRLAIPTGICIALPEGYEAQVRARSGLALRRGLGMVNGPGTVDTDYRGEIVVILINWSQEPQTVSRGDRIAQLVIAPIARAMLQEVRELDSTDRGDRGFGHTGV